MVKSFPAKEIIEYPNGGKSYFHVIDDTVIIIDENICECSSEDEVFPYSWITDKQNYYVRNYSRVFRFLKEDVGSAERALDMIDMPLRMD